MPKKRDLFIRIYCFWAAILIASLFGFLTYREYRAQGAQISQRMLCVEMFSTCLDTGADVEKCSVKISQFGCEVQSAQELYYPLHGKENRLPASGSGPRVGKPVR